MGQPKKKEPSPEMILSEEFELKIPYGTPFRDSCALFQSANNFEGKLPAIKLPALERRGNKPGIVQARRLQLPFGTSEEEARKLIKEFGGKPAEPEHVLAWGLATSIQAQTWKNTLGLGVQKTRISSCAYTGKGPYRVFLELVPGIQDATQYLGGADNQYLIVHP